VDLHMPVLYPGDVQEAIDLGRHAIALSRASGLWTSIKVVDAVADGTGTVDITLDRVRPVMPQFEPPAVYIPAPVMAEIVLSTPPPPPLITLAPAPPSQVTAPIVQVAPPEIGRAIAPPPPPISGPDRKAFATTLFGHLNRYKRYPEVARARRTEGVVSLRFTMDRQGHVLSYEIAKGSGSPELDREAQELLKRAEPLPAIPAAFARDTLDLVIPVEFFLR